MIREGLKLPFGGLELIVQGVELLSRGIDLSYLVVWRFWLGLVMCLEVIEGGLSYGC